MWVALGYQEECSLPLRLGLVRNSYLGRTFIEPEVRRRGRNMKLKLNPVRSVLADKRVVLNAILEIIASVRQNFPDS